MQKLLKQLVLPLVLAVALLQAGLFVRWYVQTGSALALQLKTKSAEQIFNENDIFYSLHKLVRQHPKVVFVEAPEPGSYRLEVELLYALYPELPINVVRDTAEYRSSIERAERADLIVSATPLTLDQRFSEIAGEGYLVYKRQ